MLKLPPFFMADVATFKKLPRKLNLRSSPGLIKPLDMTLRFDNFNTKYLAYYKARDVDYNKWGLSLFNTSNNVVKGVLTENNKPVPKVFVNLYHSVSGLLVTRVLTDSEGNFSFESIVSDAKYYIVASDPKGIYNTVTLDGIRIDSRKEYSVDIG